MNRVQIHMVKNQQDLDQCFAIRRAVFIEEDGIPPEEEYDAHDRLGGDCDHFLVMLDGMAAGTLRCLHLDSHTVQIQRVCVLRRFRKLGLGRQALEYVHAFYRGTQVRRFEMNAKCVARAFYEKLGYTAYGEVFLDADMPHIAMYREIKNPLS